MRKDRPLDLRQLAKNIKQNEDLPLHFKIFDQPTELVTDADGRIAWVLIGEARNTVCLGGPEVTFLSYLVWSIQNELVSQISHDKAERLGFKLRRNRIVAAGSSARQKDFVMGETPPSEVLPVSEYTSYPNGRKKPKSSRDTKSKKCFSFKSRVREVRERRGYTAQPQKRWF